MRYVGGGVGHLSCGLVQDENRAEDGVEVEEGSTTVDQHGRLPQYHDTDFEVNSPADVEGREEPESDSQDTGSSDETATTVDGDSEGWKSEPEGRGESDEDLGPEDGEDDDGYYLDYQDNYYGDL